jgi:alkyl hydroperoxide reductase subunit AhpF
MNLSLAALVIGSVTAFTPSSFTGSSVGHLPASSSALCMKYKVAVVGGGPSGACAAEIFAQEKGIDTVLFERKLDNAKPCGGAIPLCMVGEFNLPESVVDRKVRKLRHFCGRYIHEDSLSIVCLIRCRKLNRFRLTDRIAFWYFVFHRISTIKV